MLVYYSTKKERSLFFSVIINSTSRAVLIKPKALQLTLNSFCKNRSGIINLSDFQILFSGGFSCYKIDHKGCVLFSSSHMLPI